jgi:hypothetical protein
LKKRQNRKKRTFLELQKTHFQKKGTKNGQNSRLAVCNAATIFVKKQQKRAFLAIFGFFCKKMNFFFRQFCERHLNASHFWTYLKIHFWHFSKDIANIKIDSQASNENR